jgi:hypothetical protein
MRKQFLRFKNIPNDERSCVYDGDAGVVRHEDGVSCYEFVEQNGQFKIILPSFDTGPIFDLNNFIWRVERDEIPVYIVEGEQISLGTYGEPVIKDVKIVTKLKVIELQDPAPKFKLDKTNKQFCLD